jgi:hypothetical protein
VSVDGTQRICLPAPFNALNYFDFRSDARFESEFEILLDRIRGKAPTRGRPVRARYSSSKSVDARPVSSSTEAEAVDEIIVTNLAPLVHTPPCLYAATTRLKNLSEIPAESGLDGITLRIVGDELATFADLLDPECGLNAFIDPHTIKRTEFEQCVNDPANLTNWLALANKSLGRVLQRRGVAQDEKRRFYFPPGPSGTNRLITIGTQRPREVAAKKKHHVTGDEFWVHYCANIKFRVFGERPFLRILPSYCFTYDGEAPLDNKQAGRFRIIWGGKQDSAAVLRQILFWLLFMSEGHEEWDLDTGGCPIRMGVMPATAATRFGIATDHVSIKALVEPLDDELSHVADSANVEEVSEDELEDPGEGEPEDGS